MSIKLYIHGYIWVQLLSVEVSILKYIYVDGDGLGPRAGVQESHLPSQIPTHPAFGSRSCDPTRPPHPIIFGVGDDRGLRSGCRHEQGNNSFIFAIDLTTFGLMYT